jgi:hypothetical protein
MNPLVQVTAAPGSSTAAAAADATLLQDQDLVIGTGLPLQQVSSFDQGVAITAAGGQVAAGAASLRRGKGGCRFA